MLSLKMFEFFYHFIKKYKKIHRTVLRANKKYLRSKIKNDPDVTRLFILCK